jgi:hypothetical protein
MKLLAIAFLLSASIAAGQELHPFFQHSGFLQALYSVNIDFRKQNISGLWAIKNNSDGSSSVIMFTQTGMSILEARYAGGAAEIITCKQFIDSKGLRRLMASNIELMHKPAEVTGMGASRGSAKYKNGRTVYWAGSWHNIIRIRKRSFFGVGTDICATAGEKNLPVKITAKHSKIKMLIEWNLIENK